MPTERYSITRKQWADLDPQNIVRESNIGWDDSNLYFPAVSTCIALAMVLDNDKLVGAHFDKLLSASEIELMLNRMLEKTAAHTVNHLAVIGNMTYRDAQGTGFMSAPEYQGEQQLLTFAKKLGVKGVVSSYDQGQSANKHYRAQSIGESGLLMYCGDVTYVNGNPVPFDLNKTSWMKQPLTVLRELY